jgi:pimeloyl-ACP methyl ester carboxylesterase
MSQEFKTMELPDGRLLAWTEYGAPEGIPTLYCHGFPGSRLEAGIFDTAAKSLNLRLIAPDRNGLGESSLHPDRQLLDWATDMQALADHLEIERFFLLGVSGGGPYALACAHQLAPRLLGVSLVCPLGPLDQPGLLNAMRWPAQINFRSISAIPFLMDLTYRFSVIPFAQHWPQWIFQMMLGLVPQPDATVLRRPQIRSAITASLHEAIRQGADGLLQEMKLYTLPWGFDLAEITQPVQLWHGTADDTVPILHGRTLAERLPDCETHFVEGEGHFSLPFEHMEMILQRLIDSRIMS